MTSVFLGDTDVVNVRRAAGEPALVETAAVVIIDLAGTVTGWGPGAEALLGFGSAEAVGSAFVDLVSLPAPGRSVFRTVLTDGKSRQLPRLALRGAHGTAESSIAIIAAHGASGVVGAALMLVDESPGEAAASAYKDRQGLVALLGRLADQMTTLGAGPGRDPPGSLASMQLFGELAVTVEELSVASEVIEAQAEQLEILNATLDQDRQRYRNWLRASPDPLVVTGRTGSIMDANQAAADLLTGGDIRSLLRLPWIAFLERASVKTGLAMGREAARSLSVSEAEVDLKPRGKPAIRAWARATALHATPAEPAVVLWTIRDITERSRMQAQLEEVLRFREALMLALAHDLRSPISAIARLVDLLRSPGLDRASAAMDAFVDALVPAIATVQATIDNLLDVDRLSSGRMELRRRRTDIGALVERCADNSGLAPQVTVHGSAPAADIDAGLVERILMNLLGNAGRYGPEGGPISVTLEPFQGGVHLAVTDTGGGIPGAIKEDVFALFSQADSAGLGRGIGLYLVRQFAELHGGRAWAEDAPGGGALLQVTLPGPLAN
jgi:PAS domain S-box-containing protein